MYAFLSKVFGRKKDDKEVPSSSQPVLGPGELLGGRFEAISANTSPIAQFAELDPRNEETKDKEKEKDPGFSFFKGKWRPASPDVKPTRKLDILPHLSLNFQEPKGASASPDLGLLFTTDQILSDAVIGQRRLNPLEALVLVQACSRAIIAKGLDTLGIMHPQWYAASHKIQRRVISHFIYLSNLENATFASSPTSPTSPISAFEAEINDTFSSHDIAAILRWGLRHVQIEGDNLGTDDGWYKAFLEAEGAAGYPLKAFSDKLAPLLPAANLQLLTATLEIFSSLAAHAEVNGTSGSKLCKIFGLWLLTAHHVEDKEDWHTFYAKWERTGRMLEHLFLSRIRDESADQRMPVRLLELVRKYPYTQGLSSPTTDLPLLPRPPFTTRLHDALFVRIGTELAYGKHKPISKQHPLLLLADAFSTRVEGEYAELWSKIIIASKDGASLSFSNIFTEDTVRFLSLVPDEPSEVRSLSLVSPVSPHKPDDADKSEAIVTGHPKSTTEFSPSTPLSPLSNGIGSDWAQFSASGFLEVSPNIIPLASTLFDTDIEKTVPPEPVSRHSRKSSKHSKAASLSPLRESADGPRPGTESSAETKLEGTEEQKNIIKASQPQIIQLDEAFIDFWSDSLLDTINANWPMFIICKFKPSLVPELTIGAAKEGQKQKTIQWLVLEQVYTIRAPPVAAIPFETARPRPLSPHSPSQSLRKRFSFWSVSRTASGSSDTSHKGKKRDDELKVGEMGELLEEELNEAKAMVKVKSPIFRSRKSLDIAPKSNETMKKSISKPAEEAKIDEETTVVSAVTAGVVASAAVVMMTHELAANQPSFVEAVVAKADVDHSKVSPLIEAVSSPSATTKTVVPASEPTVKNDDMPLSTPHPDIGTAPDPELQHKLTQVKPVLEPVVENVVEPEDCVETEPILATHVVPVPVVAEFLAASVAPIAVEPPIATEETEVEETVNVLAQHESIEAPLFSEVAIPEPETVPVNPDTRSTAEEYPPISTSESDIAQAFETVPAAVDHSPLAEPENYDIDNAVSQPEATGELEPKSIEAEHIFSSAEKITADIANDETSDSAPVQVAAQQMDQPQSNAMPVEEDVLGDFEIINPLTELEEFGTAERLEAKDTDVKEANCDSVLPDVTFEPEAKIEAAAETIPASIERDMPEHEPGFVHSDEPAAIVEGPPDIALDENAPVCLGGIEPQLELEQTGTQETAVDVVASSNDASAAVIVHELQAKVEVEALGMDAIVAATATNDLVAAGGTETEPVMSTTEGDFTEHVDEAFTGTVQPTTTESSVDKVVSEVTHAPEAGNDSVERRTTVNLEPQSEHEVDNIVPVAEDTIPDVETSLPIAAPLPLEPEVQLGKTEVEAESQVETVSVSTIQDASIDVEVQPDSNLTEAASNAQNDIEVETQVDNTSNINDEPIPESDAVHHIEVVNFEGSLEDPASSTKESQTTALLVPEVDLVTPAEEALPSEVISVSQGRDETIPIPENETDIEDQVVAPADVQSALVETSPTDEPAEAIVIPDVEESPEILTPPVEPSSKSSDNASDIISDAVVPETQVLDKSTLVSTTEEPAPPVELDLDRETTENVTLSSLELPVVPEPEAPVPIESQFAEVFPTDDQLQPTATNIPSVSSDDVSALKVEPEQPEEGYTAVANSSEPLSESHSTPKNTVIHIVEDDVSVELVKEQLEAPSIPEAEENDRTAEVEPQIIPAVMEESPTQIDLDKDRLVPATLQDETTPSEVVYAQPLDTELVATPQVPEVPEDEPETTDILPESGHDIKTESSSSVSEGVAVQDSLTSSTSFVDINANSKDETISDATFGADLMPELHGTPAAVELETTADAAPDTPKLSAIPDSTNALESTTEAVQIPPAVSHQSSIINESTVVLAEGALDVEVQPETPLLEETSNAAKADTGVAVDILPEALPSTVIDDSNEPSTASTAVEGGSIGEIPVVTISNESTAPLHEETPSDSQDSDVIAADDTQNVRPEAELPLNNVDTPTVHDPQDNTSITTVELDTGATHVDEILPEVVQDKDVTKELEPSIIATAADPTSEFSTSLAGASETIEHAYPLNLPPDAEPIDQHVPTDASDVPDGHEQSAMQSRPEAVDFVQSDSVSSELTTLASQEGSLVATAAAVTSSTQDETTAQARVDSIEEASTKASPTAQGIALPTQPEDLFDREDHETDPTMEKVASIDPVVHEATVSEEANIEESPTTVKDSNGHSDINSSSVEPSVVVEPIAVSQITISNIGLPTEVVQGPSSLQVDEVAPELFEQVDVAVPATTTNELSTTENPVIDNPIEGQHVEPETNDDGPDMPEDVSQTDMATDEVILQTQDREVDIGTTKEPSESVPFPLELSGEQPEILEHTGSSIIESSINGAETEAGQTNVFTEQPKQYEEGPEVEGISETQSRVNLADVQALPEVKNNLVQDPEGPVDSNMGEEPIEISTTEPSVVKSLSFISEPATIVPEEPQFESDGAAPAEEEVVVPPTDNHVQEVIAPQLELEEAADSSSADEPSVADTPLQIDSQPETVVPEGLQIEDGDIAPAEEEVVVPSADSHVQDETIASYAESKQAVESSSADAPSDILSEPVAEGLQIENRSIPQEVEEIADPSPADDQVQEEAIAPQVEFKEPVETSYTDGPSVADKLSEVVSEPVAEDLRIENNEIAQAGEEIVDPPADNHVQDATIAPHTEFKEAVESSSADAPSDIVPEPVAEGLQIENHGISQEVEEIADPSPAHNQVQEEAIAPQVEFKEPVETSYTDGPSVADKPSEVVSEPLAEDLQIENSEIAQAEEEIIDPPTDNYVQDVTIAPHAEFKEIVETSSADTSSVADTPLDIISGPVAESLRIENGGIAQAEEEVVPPTDSHVQDETIAPRAEFKEAVESSSADEPSVAQLEVISEPVAEDMQIENDEIAQTGEEITDVPGDIVSEPVAGLQIENRDTAQEEEEIFNPSPADNQVQEGAIAPHAEFKEPVENLCTDEPSVADKPSEVISEPIAEDLQIENDGIAQAEEEIIDTPTDNHFQDKTIAPHAEFKAAVESSGADEPSIAMVSVASEPSTEVSGDLSIDSDGVTQQEEDIVDSLPTDNNIQEEVITPQVESKEVVACADEPLVVDKPSDVVSELVPEGLQIENGDTAQTEQEMVDFPPTHTHVQQEAIVPQAEFEEDSYTDEPAIGDIASNVSEPATTAPEGPRIENAQAEEEIVDPSPTDNQGQGEAIASHAESTTVKDSRADEPSVAEIASVVSEPSTEVPEDLSIVSGIVQSEQVVDSPPTDQHIQEEVTTPQIENGGTAKAEEEKVDPLLTDNPVQEEAIAPQAELREVVESSCTDEPSAEVPEDPSIDTGDVAQAEEVVDSPPTDSHVQEEATTPQVEGKPSDVVSELVPEGQQIENGRTAKAEEEIVDSPPTDNLVQEEAIAPQMEHKEMVDSSCTNEPSTAVPEGPSIDSGDVAQAEEEVVDSPPTDSHVQEEATTPQVESKPSDVVSELVPEGQQIENGGTAKAEEEIVDHPPTDNLQEEVIVLQTEPKEVVESSCTNEPSTEVPEGPSIDSGDVAQAEEEVTDPPPTDSHLQEEATAPQVESKPSDVVSELLPEGQQIENGGTVKAEIVDPLPTDNLVQEEAIAPQTELKEAVESSCTNEPSTEVPEDPSIDSGNIAQAEEVVDSPPTDNHVQEEPTTPQMESKPSDVSELVPEGQQIENGGTAKAEEEIVGPPLTNNLVQEEAIAPQTELKEVVESSYTNEPSTAVPEDPSIDAGDVAQAEEEVVDSLPTDSHVQEEATTQAESKPSDVVSELVPEGQQIENGGTTQAEEEIVGPSPTDNHIQEDAIAPQAELKVIEGSCTDEPSVADVPSDVVSGSTTVVLEGLQINNDVAQAEEELTDPPSPTDNLVQETIVPHTEFKEAVESSCADEPSTTEIPKDSFIDNGDIAQAESDLVDPPIQTIETKDIAEGAEGEVEAGISETEGMVAASEKVETQSFDEPQVYAPETHVLNGNGHFAPTQETIGTVHGLVEAISENLTTEDDIKAEQIINEPIHHPDISLAALETLSSTD